MVAGSEGPFLQLHMHFSHKAVVCLIPHHDPDLIINFESMMGSGRLTVTSSVFAL